jgi:hypothetical protein
MIRVLVKLSVLTEESQNISLRVDSRIDGGRRWVAEMGGCIAGCAHPLEESAANFRDASIHRLCSAEVWIRWRGNRIIVAAWMARSL